MTAIKSAPPPVLFQPLPFWMQEAGEVDVFGVVAVALSRGCLRSLIWQADELCSLRECLDAFSLMRRHAGSSASVSRAFPLQAGDRLRRCARVTDA